MMYQGGKTKLAKPIASIIRPSLKPGTHYVEPFLGSAAIAVELVPYSFVNALSDGHLDVAMMWSALLDGWQPPSVVTREDYAAQKDARPSELRGFVGTVCSFGGKWFGGYASGDSRNFADNGRRSVLARTSVLRAADVDRVCYRDYRDTRVTSDSVVYCDPPYSGTVKYKATGDFDSTAFWAQMNEWVSVGARVYVSEFTATGDWVSVWEKDRHTSTALNNSGKRALDKLFVHESQAQ